MKTLRYWEIDSLRGIAIIAMIIFHILFALDYFGKYSTGIGSLSWRIIGILTASTFLFLVGTSLTLSYSKVKDEPKTGVYKKYIKRGLGIFALGLAITAITYFIIPKEYVMFGILHLIGLSIIFCTPRLKSNFMNLVSGSVLILAGVLLQQYRFDFNQLAWLGFIPNGLTTLDYFPILPWLGVVLIGISFGNQAYTNGLRQFKLPDLSENKIVKFFCFLGRHSLLIYFLHFPIILSLVYLL